MAKTKKKRKKAKKISKLKIWSLIFMYLITIMLLVAAILNVIGIGINVPYYNEVTETQNMLILILSATNLIYIIISNVGLKKINAIMFINSLFLAFLVIISFKFCLKGCIISTVFILFNLFYLGTIYDNSDKS